MTTDLEVLRTLADPAGREVLDVGCGDGRFTRALAGLGSRVTGVEISDERVAAARAADPGAVVRYLVGRAERLPVGDSSVDLVVFRTSLHHVPVGEMEAALREAARVVRPGGIVYVAEPLTTGDFYRLVSIVDDEDQVRAAAQLTLDRAGDAGLELVAVQEYEIEALVGDLAEVRARLVAVEPSRAVVFDARRDELQRCFEQLGRPVDGGRRLTEIMRAIVLRAPNLA